MLVFIVRVPIPSPSGQVFSEISQSIQTAKQSLHEADIISGMTLHFKEATPTYEGFYLSQRLDLSFIATFN